MPLCYSAAQANNVETKKDVSCEKPFKTRGFWMTYKINNVYYLTYVYRFCSQFCSQNTFAILKEEPMTIRKIHMCSYIIKKIINLLSNPLGITGTPSELLNCTVCLRQQQVKCWVFRHSNFQVKYDRLVL